MQCIYMHPSTLPQKLEYILLKAYDIATCVPFRRMHFLSYWQVFHHHLVGISRRSRSTSGKGWTGSCSHSRNIVSDGPGPHCTSFWTWTCRTYPCSICWKKVADLIFVRNVILQSTPSLVVGTDIIFVNFFTAAHFQNFENLPPKKAWIATFQIFNITFLAFLFI